MADGVKSWLRDRAENFLASTEFEKIYFSGMIFAILVFLLISILPLKISSGIFSYGTLYVGFWFAVGLLNELYSRAKTNLAGTVLGVILQLPIVGSISYATGEKLVQAVNREDPSAFPAAVGVLASVAAVYWWALFLSYIFAISSVALFVFGILDHWLERPRSWLGERWRRLKKYLEVREPLEFDETQKISLINVTIPRVIGSFFISATLSLACLSAYNNIERLYPWVQEILVLTEYSESHPCSGIPDKAQVSHLGGELISVAIRSPETDDLAFVTQICERVE